MRMQRCSVRQFISKLIVCGIIAQFSMSTQAGTPVTAPHPERRKVAAPSGGEAVAVNPPVLLWPVTSGSNVRYEVRLSRSADVVKDAEFHVLDLRWAFFNPHRRLESGRWYWQYRVTGQSKGKSWTSPVHQFDVTDAARVSVKPPASEFLQNLPDQHPRLLVSASQLDLLRQRIKDAAFLSSVTHAARRLLGRPVRRVDAARPAKKGKTDFEAKNFAKWASKGYAANLLSETQTLTLAYLLTGDKEYGEAAVTRGVAVAQLDPNGPTARRVSDFADGSCMEAMALVYDSCFDLLDQKQRKLMRAAMLVRTAPWFSRQINSLESRVFNAHIWQHIMLQATDVAIALHGEVPDADTWLSYVYEVWLARVPLLGGDDGAWANGINYFGTNFKTLLVLPALFERYTNDADFFDHPWYRNTIYYQLYAWPPGSASDGFGDGAERTLTPSSSRAMFLYFLGERFQDPNALWYANQVAGSRSLDSLLPPALRIDRVLREKPEKLPEPHLSGDLPKSRAFIDTGIALMHTHLESPQKDLMIAFRSSPFGSFNHMHSDQNSFNVNFGGRRLFCGSGYYIGYGDDHFKGWYTHTRGHNSILIDGKGQVRSASGYGNIIDYGHNAQATYCIGDASHAYGDAGLTRFHRHLVFLRPDTLVVYDDLAADHAAQWSWLLHSPDRIDKADHADRVTVRNDVAAADVNLFASSKLRIDMSDQFDPPAVNWRDRKSGGKLVQYPNQWHVSAEPVERQKSARFLAVLTILPPSEANSLEAPVQKLGHVIRTSRWSIAAEMDAKKPASLSIETTDGTSVLQLANAH